MKLLISILIGVITLQSCKGDFTDFSQLSVDAKFEAMAKRLDELESLVANLIQKVLQSYI